MAIDRIFIFGAIVVFGVVLLPISAHAVTKNVCITEIDSTSCVSDQYSRLTIEIAGQPSSNQSESNNFDGSIGFQLNWDKEDYYAFIREMEDVYWLENALKHRSERLWHVDSSAYNQSDIIAIFGLFYAGTQELGLFDKGDRISVRRREISYEGPKPHVCGYWEEVAVIPFSTPIAIFVNGVLNKQSSNTCIDSNEDINFLQQQEILISDPYYEKHPINSLINRAEFTKMIYLAAQLKHCPSSISFTDVPKDSWYTQYLETAICSGIISGHPDNTFRPADNVNLAEAAAIITKAFNFEVIPDSSSEWYIPYVKTLSSRNLIPVGVERFDQKLTRKDIAAILHRILTSRFNIISVPFEDLK